MSTIYLFMYFCYLLWFRWVKSWIEVGVHVIFVFCLNIKNTTRHASFSTSCSLLCWYPTLCLFVPFTSLVIWILSSWKVCIWTRLTPSNVDSNNRHKSKTEHLLLDSKKWHFHQSTFFEQLMYCYGSFFRSSFSFLLLFFYYIRNIKYKYLYINIFIILIIHFTSSIFLKVANKNRPHGVMIK